MSNTLTVEDFFKIFQESDRKNQEAFARMREEADRREQAFFARLQEEAELREREAELREREAERDRQEARARSKELDKQIGALTGKWGLFVENLVEPACVKIFSERGIPVSQTMQRVRGRKGGRNVEIDILVVNGTDVVAVEVKTTLTDEDVQNFLQTLAEFRFFFPHLKDYRLLGAMAAMVAGDNTLAFARRQGLFVIVPSGETVRIDNPPDFQPKAW